MRTTWNGSLTFGLVSIPVGLAPATKPAARQSDVSFRLLHRECLTPIKQKRWCPKHDRELTPDEIVKGWEASKGQFVLVEEAELEALEGHDDSRSIEISQFVPVEQVDPIWRDRTYFLVPGAAPAQRRPYRLLLEAMRETGTGALGRFVRTGRESLCLVRSRGDSLVLETLFLAEDVYSDAEISEAVGTTEVKKPELALAHQIIDSLDATFDPATLTSSYRRDLRALLEAKLQGEELTPVADVEPERAPAVDLLEALKASVAAAKVGRNTPAKPSRRSRRRRPRSRGRARRVSLERCAAKPRLLERSTLRGARGASGVLNDREADGFGLGLEKMLVDLAVVDRHAFFDAQLDDHVAVDAELDRQLLGRQMIRHASPPSSIKKARRARCAVGLSRRSDCQ